MTPSHDDPADWTARELDHLHSLLDAVPAPYEPLDISAVDGFLVGCLLQPTPIERSQWLPYVLDHEGRPLPPSIASQLALPDLVQALERRHAELNRAISRREWFDPWVFELDDDASAADAVLPWIAGWSAALEAFPALLGLNDPALREPLATLLAYFDPEDLEDVDDLADLLADMAPAETLEDAVQDIVRSTLLIADVSRPRADPAPVTGAPRKTARRGANPARRAQPPRR
jgi:uncharacterized protein